MMRCATLLRSVLALVALLSVVASIACGGGGSSGNSYSARCAAGAQTTSAARPSTAVDWSKPEEIVLKARDLIASQHLTPVDRTKLLEAAWAEAIRDEQFLPARLAEPVNVSLGERMSPSEEEAAITTGLAQLGAELKDSAVEKEFFYAVISGMANSLQDSHTYFYAPSLSGPYFEGRIPRAGFLWDKTDNGFVITDVQPGSQADLAGLQPGDTILPARDRAAPTFQPQSDDDSIKLRILKRGGGQEIDVELKSHGEPWLQSKLLASNIGYIRLYGFPFPISCETLSQQRSLFENAISDLKRQGAKGWVLDLRDNPGGSADTAGYVASRLGFDGVFITGRDRYGTFGQPLEVLGDDASGGGPMVVLINGHSASASEIVSYNLQQYGRAYVIGTQSEGAVVSTSPFNLAGGALFITHSFVNVGPGNKVLDKIGVTPNEKLELDKTQLAQDGTDNQVAAALDYLGKKLGR